MHLKNALSVLGLSVLLVGCSAVARPQNGDQIMRGIHSQLEEKVMALVPEVVPSPEKYISNFGITGNLNPGAISPLSDSGSVDFAMTMKQSVDSISGEAMMEMAGFVGGDMDGETRQMELDGSLILTTEDAFVQIRKMNGDMPDMDEFMLPAEAFNRWFSIPAEDFQGMIQSPAQQLGVQMLTKEMVGELLAGWYIWQPIGAFEVVEGRYEFDIQSSPESVRDALVSNIDTLIKYMDGLSAMAMVTGMDGQDDLMMAREELINMSAEELAYAIPSFAGVVSVSTTNMEDVQIRILGSVVDDPEIVSFTLVNNTSGGQVRIEPGEMVDGVFVADIDMGEFGFDWEATGAFELSMLESTTEISGIWTEDHKQLEVAEEGGYYDDEYNWIETGIETSFMLDMKKMSDENVWSGSIMIPAEDVEIKMDRLMFDMGNHQLDMSGAVEMEGVQVAEFEAVGNTRPARSLEIVVPENHGSTKELMQLMDETMGSGMMPEDVIEMEEVELSAAERAMMVTEIIEMRTRQMALIDAIEYDNEPAELAASQDIITSLAEELKSAPNSQIVAMHDMAESEFRFVLSRNIMMLNGEDEFNEGLMLQIDALELDELEALALQMSSASKQKNKAQIETENPQARATQIDTIIEIERRHYALIDAVYYDNDPAELAATVDILADREKELQTLPLNALQEEIFTVSEEYAGMLSSLSEDEEVGTSLAEQQEWVVEEYEIDAFAGDAEVPCGINACG